MKALDGKKKWSVFFDDYTALSPAGLEYGNLTLCGNTLWVRVKRHAIHRGCIVLCTEDMWKATTRVHRLHMTRMVENILCDILKCH